MTSSQIRGVAHRVYRDAIRNRTTQTAAALAYYFVLSLFPGLVFLSAVASYLPVPNLFGQSLALMSRFLPADSMGVVRGVLSDVISPHRATFLSVGLIATLWTLSGGFSAAIEAISIAYEIDDDRPFWKVRLLAIGLAIISEIFFLISLSVMLVGPRFGDWIAYELRLSYVFAAIWPYVQWGVALSFTVLAVEAFYYFAPGVKQRFLETLPGAVVSVTCWILLSYSLGVYFRNFANFNKTYGTLGAAIALMVSLYWTSFALLIGARLNFELDRESTITKKRPQTRFPAAA